MSEEVKSPIVVAKLNKSIEWWRSNQEDPYNIGNSVIAALSEVRNALLESVPVEAQLAAYVHNYEDLEAKHEAVVQERDRLTTENAALKAELETIRELLRAAHGGLGMTYAFDMQVYILVQWEPHKEGATIMGVYRDREKAIEEVRRSQSTWAEETCGSPQRQIVSMDVIE